MMKTVKKYSTSLMCATLALLISGCGLSGDNAASNSGESSTPATSELQVANSSRATEPVESVEAPSVAAEPSPTQQELAPSIGEPSVSDSVTITAHSAEFSPTVSRNLSNYRAGSGYETYTAVEADQGGHFLILNTTVENTGRTAMDLTCGYPINILAVDDQDRIFNATKSLYEIEGNPECNSQLQPGFSSDITYAFMVPENANILGVMFQSTSSENSEDVGLIRIPAS